MQDTSYDLPAQPAMSMHVVAAVTVKLPAFCMANPVGWFAQAKVQFTFSNSHTKRNKKLAHGELPRLGHVNSSNPVTPGTPIKALRTSFHGRNGIKGM